MVFRVALIGHSHVPTGYEYPLDEEVRLYFYRLPGATISEVKNHPRFRSFWNSRFDLTILFIGGNDIKPDVNPRAVIDEYKHLLHSINGKDCACITTTIEHRIIYRDNRFALSQEIYNQKSRSVNRHLVRYFGHVSQEFISLSRGIFTGERAQDGVHFSPILLRKLYRLLTERIRRRKFYHSVGITSFSEISRRHRQNSQI